MAKDLRASQIQTTQIIASGSSGTEARIVFYPHEVQSTVNPNQGIINSTLFNTSSIGRDIFVFISGGIGQRNTNNNSITAFGGDTLASGSVYALGGFSGSLTRLADGSSYLLAGTNITLSTGSNGAVTINSTGGGGGADADWTVSGSSLYTTSSIVIGQAANTNEIGEDVFFYVSGTFGSGSAGDAVALFGGDVKISGTLAIGQTSLYISEYSIKFSNIPNNESNIEISIDDIPDASVGLISDLLIKSADVLVSGAGGNLTLRAGEPGEGPGTSTGYKGGDLEYYTGTGNSPTVGGKKAGNGGKHYFVAGDGGNQNNAGGGGGGGTGGGFEFYSGFGGGAVEGAGGTGGNFLFSCGNGSGGPIGGSGGGIEFYTGNGGSGGTGNGGAGGNFYVSTGDGGDAGANSGPIYAGSGGDASFYLGDGGNDENTDEVAGAGGRFVVVAGNGGSSDSGTHGAPGTISLEAGNSFLSPGFIELKVGTKYDDPDTLVAERYGTIYLTDRSDQVNSVYNSANNDEFLVISGSTTSGSSARYASFRGSIKTSGSIAWDNNVYILKDGNDLKFFDLSNPGGYTLTQLAATGGGGGSDVDWTDGGGRLKTTSSVSIDGSNQYANEKTADAFFYVSGTVNRRTAAGAPTNLPIVLINSDTYISGVLHTGLNHTLISSSWGSIVGGSNNYISSSFSAGIFAGNQNRIEQSFTGIILGSSGSHISSSGLSTIVGGLGHRIFRNPNDINAGDSNYSAILGGWLSFISGSDGVVILGGTGSHVDSSNWSGIVGGWENRLRRSVQSFIGGGFANRIDGQTGFIGDSGWSGIIAGDSNSILGSSQYANGILAGFNNRIVNSGINNAILAGQNNAILGSRYSGIVGGDGDFITDSWYGGILGGTNNTIFRSDWSAIVGSDNEITGSTSYGDRNYIFGSTNSARNNRSNVMLLGFNLTAENADDQVLIGGTGNSLVEVTISASNVNIKEGPLLAYNGLSGSLTRLTDGSSYLLAGTNITLSTGSNGAVTINSTGGGGGGGDSYFFSNELNTIETTGSVRITGSLTHGSGTFAIGEKSHAEGFLTLASGAFSHAEGRATTAFGLAAHAEGNVTYAGAQVYEISSIDNVNGIFTLDASHGDVTSQIFVGLFFTSDLENGYGYVRTAVNFDGTNTHITASDALDIGSFLGTYLWNRNSEAANTSFILGSGSHAEGYLTTAVGDHSHVEGSGSIAIGAFSHAEGESNYALGKASLAIGTNTFAIGKYSLAAGGFSVAYGEYSLAAGAATNASGAFSATFGAYTISSGSGQLVAGRYNLRGNENSLFVIGDGTGDDDVDRSDILRVNSNSPGNGRVEVTGSLVATRGLSGSLTTLADGSSYLIAGTNITLSTGSNGAITINSTGGGGGGGDSYFFSNEENVIETTGSVEITGSISIGQGVKYNPTFVTASRTIVNTEFVVGVSASSALTLTLPASPENGKTFIVKDIAGNAASNNLIVSSSTHTIDGASIYTIAINYGSAQFVYFENMNTWGVI